MLASCVPQRQEATPGQVCGAQGGRGRPRAGFGGVVPYSAGNVRTPPHCGAVSSSQATGRPLLCGGSADTRGWRWGCSVTGSLQGASSCGVTGLRGHDLPWELGEAAVRSGGVAPEGCVRGGCGRLREAGSRRRGRPCPSFPAVGQGTLCSGCPCQPQCLTCL